MRFDTRLRRLEKRLPRPAVRDDWPEFDTLPAEVQEVLCGAWNKTMAVARDEGRDAHEALASLLPLPRLGQRNYEAALAAVLEEARRIFDEPCEEFP